MGNRQSPDKESMSRDARESSDGQESLEGTPKSEVQSPRARRAMPLFLRGVDGLPATLRDSDRETLAQIALALWEDPALAESQSCEALAAASLRVGPPELMVERAAALLLRWSQEEGESHSELPGSAFRRLPHQARFLLSALHGHSRWSWRRMARIFALASAAHDSEKDLKSHDAADALIDLISRLAWSARVELAWDLGKGYPSGVSQKGDTSRSCPDYDPRAPWTQRFLDEELQARERVFIQNHLMACAACRNTLDQARKLFHSVEAQLRKELEESSLGGKDLINRARIAQSLDQVMTRRRLVFGGSRLGFFESLKIHLESPRNQILWVTCALLLLSITWYHLR